MEFADVKEAQEKEGVCQKARPQSCPYI